MNRTRSLVVVLALAVTGFSAVPALADAPDPVPSATQGTLVTNPDGSRTLSLKGAWQWTTHHSDCNTDRAGVGVAIDWNDPTNQGNLVTGAGNLGDFFVGTSTDNVVHPTPGPVFQDIGTPADYLQWRGGCGTFNGTYNTGTWGTLQHTYPASVKGPISVCPVMYDVHGKTSGTAPNGVKEVTAGGNNHNGDNSLQDNANTPLGNGCFQTTFSTPGIDVVKTAGETGVRVGDTIHYTVKVTNTGDTTLTVSPSDTRCDGFSGSAFTLAPGASQTLTCTHTATAGDGSSYANTACASGTDSSGATVNDCDTVTTPISHPAIAIDKTGPATANAGDKVAYILTVTNPGDTSFIQSNVNVTDPRCNGAPVTLIGQGGDASPGTLDPGDAWTYTCSVQSSTSDTLIHNVATVVGTDTGGRTVQASDDADTKLTPPGQAVLGARITPGSANLVGPTGCTSKAFSARVRGSKIATVTFVLDGKVVKRLRKPTSKGVYALRVDPSKMRVGVHRLVANITFQSGSRTKPKTMRLSFQRCSKKLAAPRFTG